MNSTPLSLLANHLWQSTPFAAAAWLLTLALRKNGARVRHGVWLAASCKFLIPFSALVALGGQVRWRTAPAAAPPVLYSAMDAIGQPFRSAAGAAVLPGHAAAVADLLPEVLFGIWMFGSLWLAVSWWVRWRRIGAAVRGGSPVHLVDIPIEAISSPTLLEPGVFGVLRPVLLLPEGLCDRLTPAQLQTVIAHELCHLRHRDNLVAALHMFVETVFWFHPPVWWIGKRMLEERERACDEEVLRMGSEPRTYAEGILNVCRHYVESPLACVPGVTGSNLSLRIEAIMANRKALRLSFAKKAVLAVAGIVALGAPVAVGLLNAPSARAQAAVEPTPKFEVASVKPCKVEPNQMRGPGDSSPGRLSIGCEVLVDPNYVGLIQRAYVRFAGGHIDPMTVLPITGGPAWIHSDMYRINAKAEGTPSREMMQGPMLQAILEDRFKLRVHREVKEGPVYELTVAKGGPKFKRSPEGGCVQMPLTGPVRTPPPGQRYCKVIVYLLKPAVDAEGSTVVEFSKLLNLVLDRPVIDKTGLTGRFDIHLEFARNEATPGMRGPGPDEPAATASDPTDPTIFTAIQEQLGLKLELRRGPNEFLVIDHVERPSEN